MFIQFVSEYEYKSCRQTSGLNRPWGRGWWTDLQKLQLKGKRKRESKETEPVSAT